MGAFIMIIKGNKQRLTLCLCCVAFFCILTSCQKVKQVFANNPVLQAVAEELGEGSSSGKKAKTEKAEEEEKIEQPTYTFEEKQLFEGFVERIRKSSDFSYTRVLAKENAQAGDNYNEIERILNQSKLYVLENQDSFLYSDYIEQETYAFKEKTGKLIKMESGNYALVEHKDSYQRHLLYYICKYMNPQLVSTERVTIGGETFVAYNVSENGELTQWFFDEQDMIKIRLFSQEGQQLIKYSDLLFNIPVDEGLWNPKGTQLPQITGDN